MAGWTAEDRTEVEEGEEEEVEEEEEEESGNLDEEEIKKMQSDEVCVDWPLWYSLCMAMCYCAVSVFFLL